MKEIQDSLNLGFWIPRRGFRFQVLSMELGFLIPSVNRIPDSLNCIPDSKARYSRFHKQNFPRFRNLDSLYMWGNEGRVVRTLDPC